MRVNVIGKSNGVGLSRDLELMSTALRGCGCHVDVTLMDSRESKRRRSRIVQTRVQLRRVFRNARVRPSYDLNVMLEHVWTQLLNAAEYNVAVPNPEWFDRHDLRFLPCIDRVWAKTMNTGRIFQAREISSTYIGFDSEDRYDADIFRRRTFLHLAGGSSMKGTQRLLEVWRQHPQWPELIVIWHGAARTEDDGSVPNIRFHSEYLDDVALKKIQNSSVFHVCTSETEGWGHYIVEAMSVGAVTLTVDAPPMSELVTAERGILLAHGSLGRQKLATLYRFDAAALIAAVNQALEMPPAEVANRSAAARRWFVENKAGFTSRIGKALEDLKLRQQPTSALSNKTTQSEA